MEEPLTTVIITIFGSVMASTGFWLFVNRIVDRRSKHTKLLLGVARDRIIFLGVKYIDRGSITKDEFDDYMLYFVEPYLSFGGNGLAEKIVNQVKNLPIKRYTPTTDDLRMFPEG